MRICAAPADPSTFGTAIALISRRDDVAVRGRRSHAVLGVGILALKVDVLDADGSVDEEAIGWIG
jgi:hypothetical protein